MVRRKKLRQISESEVGMFDIFVKIAPEVKIHPKISEKEGKSKSQVQSNQSIKNQQHIEIITASNQKKNKYKID